jgi:hypothetical protein
MKSFSEILSGIITKINENQSEIEIHLLIHGLIVSGKLIGFKEFREIIHTNNNEVSLEADPQSDPPFLVIKNAEISTPGHSSVNQKPFWIVNVDAVDAFWL